MSTFVALLRGINVGGKNKLPMQALVAIFSGAKCTNVRTYIQSGNVVFDASEAVAKTIANHVAQAIKTEFGYVVPVVVRTKKALAAIAASHPHAASGEDTLHVMFLADAPTKTQLKALDHQRSPGDSFTVVGADIFVCCPNGVGRSKLTNDYFDRTLSTVSTMRNWRTVQALLEMMQ